MNPCTPACQGHQDRRAARQRGLTLVELMVAMVIVAILASIALPSYRQHVIRGARAATQAQLVELAGVQEKIFLNGNAYTDKISTAYTGTASGGLGVTGGKSRDGRYTLSVSVSGASYVLTATPVSGTTQANDGNLTLSSDGSRTWGSGGW